MLVHWTACLRINLQLHSTATVYRAVVLGRMLTLLVPVQEHVLMLSAMRMGASCGSAGIQAQLVMNLAKLGQSGDAPALNQVLQLIALPMLGHVPHMLVDLHTA